MTDNDLLSFTMAASGGGPIEAGKVFGRMNQ
jgi:hypothetical protein